MESPPRLSGSSPPVVGGSAPARPRGGSRRCVQVTVEEVHRILAGDRPPQTREEDAALVRGYRDAMSFVLRRADDRAFKWDRELLIGLHDRILAGNWGAGAGRFRTGPAHLIENRTGELVFQPPPPEDVPELVDH